MIDLDLCLEVVLAMSTIALHSTLSRLGSKGPPIGNGIWDIKWPRDRPRDPKGAMRQHCRLSYSDSLASCYDIAQKCNVTFQ